MYRSIGGRRRDEQKKQPEMREELGRIVLFVS